MFIDNYLPFLDEPYQNLFRLQMMAINQLNERIRHDEPLVEFAEQVSDTTNLIDMNAMAKLASVPRPPCNAALLRPLCCCSPMQKPHPCRRT